jgi:hypothetical protein
VSRRVLVGSVFGMRVVQVDEPEMRELLKRSGTPDYDPKTSVVMIADREVCMMSEAIAHLRRLCPPHAAASLGDAPDGGGKP